MIKILQCLPKFKNIKNLAAHLKKFHGTTVEKHWPTKFKDRDKYDNVTLPYPQDIRSNLISI